MGRSSKHLKKKTIPQTKPHLADVAARKKMSPLPALQFELNLKLAAVVRRKKNQCRVYVDAVKEGH